MLDLGPIKEEFLFFCRNKLLNQKHESLQRIWITEILLSTLDFKRYFAKITKMGFNKFYFHMAVHRNILL